MPSGTGASSAPVEPAASNDRAFGSSAAPWDQDRREIEHARFARLSTIAQERALSKVPAVRRYFELIDAGSSKTGALKMAAQESLGRVAEAVRRLTRAPAAFFGIDAGRMDVGAQADLALIDPQALARYDTDASRRMVYRETFEHDQLVNRSDGVVTGVFIAGEQVWDGSTVTPVLGRRKLGRALTAAA